MSKVKWSLLKQTSCETFHKEDNEKNNSQIPGRLYTELQILCTAGQWQICHWQIPQSIEEPDVLMIQEQ